MIDKHDLKNFHYAILFDNFDRLFSLMQRQVVLKRFFVKIFKIRVLFKNLKLSICNTMQKFAIDILMRKFFVLFFFNVIAMYTDH